MSAQVADYMPDVPGATAAAPVAAPVAAHLA
jgi:hypothetical protein